MRIRSSLSILFLLAFCATPSWAQDDDIMAQKGFGHAVAITGSELFVAEPSNARIPGRVYVYRRDETSGLWTHSAIIASPRGVPGDGFGAGIAVDGTVLVVSATAGATQGLYTFERANDGAWIAKDEVDPSAYGSGGRLLGPVALSDGRMTAVLGYDGGAVRLATFVRASDTWGPPELQALDLSIPEGDVLSMTSAGEVLPGADPVYEDGRVAIYEPGRFGSELFRPLVDDALGAAALEEGTDFGTSLAVAESLAVVGDRGAGMGYGRAFVFEREGGSDSWTFVQMLEPVLASGYPSIVGSDVPCEGGRAGGFDCLHVDVRSFLNLESIGLEPGMQVNDVWGWTDAETGKEYAVVCATDRTVFIDVSDPNHPIPLGSLASTPGTRPNWWRDAKVYRHYAYIVADGVGNHGLQIFDLAQLRDVVDPPVAFEMSGHYDGFADAHNLYINEDTGFAYVVGINGGGRTCAGGLHVLDLSDPLAPQFVGCFSHAGTGESGDGYTHDTQCVIYHGPDERYTGREICVSSNETAISVADVTDKSNMTAVATGAYPNSSYVHQGWFSEDQRYFFQNDETDELNGLTDGTRMMVWDMAQLDDPVLAAEYVNANKATDHNFYVVGSRLYQSNYLSGLRVLDVSNPEQPVEIGYFDTVPWGEDRPGFGGSWSNFPFFASGTIVVTSGEEGVFLLKLSEATP